MAKITIAGSSYVVTSKISMDDLELVKKYRPQSLKIVDEETKDELFAIGTGHNGISEYGISFGGVSNCESKLATATMQIPADVEDASEFVLERIGIAVMRLNEIEAKICEVLDEITQEKAKIAQSITIVA